MSAAGDSGGDKGLIWGGGAALVLANSLLSMLVVGMGHGWDLPMKWIFAGMLAHPAALVVFLRGTRLTRGAMLGVLGCATIVAAIIVTQGLLVDFEMFVGDQLVTYPRPYGLMALIGGCWAIAALWGRRKPAFVASSALLAAALLGFLAIIYNTLFLSESFGYRNDWTEHLWFAIWAVWGLLALLAMVSALSPSWRTH